MEWFWTWLRQPSTLRALNILIGLVGINLSPEMWGQIVTAMGAIWIIIDGFYNKQPAKPE